MPVALTIAVVCVLVAPLPGLEIASLLIGMVVGLLIAGCYLVVRVLEPIERGI